MTNLDSKQDSLLHSHNLEKVEAIVNNKEINDDICSFLKVIAEESRLKIILALSQGEMCVFHLVEACNSNQSAVSHQLKILKDYKIVKSIRKGKNIIYSLDDEHIMEILNLVKIHLKENKNYEI